MKNIKYNIVLIAVSLFLSTFATETFAGTTGSNRTGIANLFSGWLLKF